MGYRLTINGSSYRLLGDDEEINAAADDIRDVIINQHGVIDAQTNKGRITAQITSADSVLLREIGSGQPGRAR
jgi:hypothetical protein